jgi:hypothetical protein
MPEPVQTSITIGRRLYDALFAGQVRDIYLTALSDASHSGNGLRLQLRLADAPGLTYLPWEFLYDGKDFLVLSSEMPLVYYLDLPSAPRLVEVQPPLRVLVTVSGPADLPPLDDEAEKYKLLGALKPLVEAGLAHVDFAPDATLGTLQTALRQAASAGKPYHVWHFIGHGAFDKSQKDSTSVLMFTGENGMATPAGGFQLGTMFNGYPEVRLVVLNACQGARSSREDPFNGVAAQLVENGISAVIGMQFEISDSAAIRFSGEFYHALVDGLPIDAALAEARRAIFFIPNWVEWATPVLFMRVRDGQLFGFAGRALAEPTGKTPAADSRRVPRPTPVAPPLAAPPPDPVGGRETMAVHYTNQLVYTVYPREPGPGDTNLLPKPWFVILQVHVGQEQQVIGLHLYGDVFIGRHTETSTGAPMISLAEFVTDESGLSREHAILHPTMDALYIIDNHSRNGVLVNRVPAIPGVATRLDNMDRINLSKVVLDVFIVQPPGG